ncbi:MAG: hypothetical protein IT372_06575 [Polyangiaceae bacterium]|nr:hypothetical protein [Polyangiaceae bacterium]
MPLPIPRAHLFEWNDLPWAPAALRDTIVESLSRTLRWGRMLQGLVPPFQRFLAESGAAEVLDLCAGAAGPARILAGEIRGAGATPPRFLLTDLFPRPDAWAAARAELPGVIDFEPAPVDATAIPAALSSGRARVIINAFHHFPPRLARAILADAVRGSAGIFISEPFDRNPLRFLSFVPVGVAALAANPALTAEDRLEKALLTWATPAALAASGWDGFVSTLRVYTERELWEMVAPLGDGFRWEHGTYTYSPMGRGYYFYGVPR